MHAYAVLGGEGTGSRDEKAGKATLLDSVVGFSNYRGQWKDAERFQFEAIELREEVFGSEHRSTLSSMGNLGVASLSPSFFQVSAQNLFKS